MTRIAAAVMTAPRVPLELREFPEPEIESGGVLLRTLHSEVCGTDVHLHHGRLSGVPYPIIPGHVSIGVVAGVRGTVRSGLGEPVREGDVVTFLDVFGTCYNCYYCLVADQPTRCASRRVYGITLSASDGLLGGWSQAIYLKPGVKVVHTPKALSPETFIGGGCGLVTALHAVDMARLRLGESVAVMGVGPVGQSVVALASLSGAGEICAVDAVASRLEYAPQMGATSTISLDLHRGDRLPLAHARTSGRGFDVVIEASGSPDAVSEALDFVRDGGRVIVCGHYTDNGSVEIHPHWQINRKHVELRGCWGSRYEHFQRAVEIAARFGGEKPWSRMIGGDYALERINDALAAVENRSAIKVLVSPAG